jgi:shikimate kinase
MIKEVVEVDEADATKAYGRGERREDYADAWENTGRVVLVGLPGSGKAALAGLLAHRLGLAAVTPGDAQEAVAALAGPAAVIVLRDDLVADPAVQPHIHGAGKVFYLMADSRTLADRVAEQGGHEDADTVWPALSARLADMEPVFYGVLHFILQAAQAPEALVDDALEKIAL